MVIPEPVVFAVLPLETFFGVTGFIVFVGIVFICVDYFIYSKATKKKPTDRE